MVLIVLVAGLVVLLARMFCTIQPYQVGLVVILGSFRATARPGFSIVSPLANVIRVDLRSRVETVAPFPAALSDGSPFTVSARVEYRVTDAPKATFSTTNLSLSVQEAIRRALGEAAAVTAPGQLPSRGWALGGDALARLQEPASRLGVTIGQFSVGLQGPTGLTEFTAGTKAG